MLYVGDEPYRIGDANVVADDITYPLTGAETFHSLNWWNVDQVLVDGETIDVALVQEINRGPDRLPIDGRLTVSDEWTSRTYPTACRKLFPDHAPGRVRLGDSYLGCARDRQSQWFVVSLQDDRDYEIEIETHPGARLVPNLAHANPAAYPTHRITWGARRYDVCERVRVPDTNPWRTYCRFGRDWLRVDTRRSDLRGGEYLIRVEAGSIGISNPDYRIRVRER